MREQQEQHARAEREGGGERAERAGQHLDQVVHTAVPEPGEDPGGDVQKAHQGARPADERGDGLGTRSSQRAPRTSGSAWNRFRHFPICPDRHRIP
ncbi:hypothetical protein GCM10010389_24480 [Streptomyces echinoruber]|uniref:Uncharacterized protein n=1 Tax=Streptomyces echinoruber TaxID=68898 RepID=A0A918R3E6_9ACTN|nr:hypothetical protein GCM10010389_24480 [Streptomyces echinoruber]